MAEDNQPAPCYFLDLPPELRDIIYEYTFSRPQVEIKPPDLEKRQPRIQRCNAGLVLTCKQIHAESIKEYYKNTRFYCYAMTTRFNYRSGIHIGTKWLRKWVIKLPLAYREAIKHVEIICSTGNLVTNWKEKMADRRRYTWVLRELDDVGVPVEVQWISGIAKDYVDWLGGEEVDHGGS